MAWIYTLSQTNKIQIKIFLNVECFHSVFRLDSEQHQIQAEQGFSFETRIWGLALSSIYCVKLAQGFLKVPAEHCERWMK